MPHPSSSTRVVAPGGKVHRPPEGRCWGLSEEDVRTASCREAESGLARTRNSQPNVIRYLSEVEGMVPWTWWPSEEVGHTDEAKKEIHALFGKVDAFDTPKPEKADAVAVVAIARIPATWLLDSFAGSGTTTARWRTRWGAPRGSWWSWASTATRTSSRG